MHELEQNDFHGFCDVVKGSSVDDLTRLLWPDDPRYDPTTRPAPVAERNFNSEATHWAWMRELQTNIDEYRWLYERLDDQVSKDTLTSVMRYRLSWDGAHLDQTQWHDQYFDWSLIRRRNDAVYVDAGAYDGDSIVGFVDRYGDGYRRIHAFEPSSDSYLRLRENCAGYRDVLLHQKGLWDEATTLTCAGQGQAVTVVATDQDHGDAVDTVTLDAVLDDEPSLIKMDIEGAEVRALVGANGVIQAAAPQLAISVYHLIDHLRVIPGLVTEINDDYALALRRVCQLNGVTGSCWLLASGGQAPVEGDLEGIQGGFRAP